MFLLMIIGVWFRLKGYLSGDNFTDLLKATVIAYFGANSVEHFTSMVQQHLVSKDAREAAANDPDAIPQLKDIFDKDKGIFVLIAIGIVVVKFRDLFLDFLINSAKNVNKNAQKKDSVLADQETQLKQQADAAVQQAQQDAPKDGPVSDDWYKKDN
ncbi:unnamed protein product [Sphagnum balticum]